jgi:hypothetical protein
VIVFVSPHPFFSPDKSALARSRASLLERAPRDR